MQKLIDEYVKNSPDDILGLIILCALKKIDSEEGLKKAIEFHQNALKEGTMGYQIPTSGKKKECRFYNLGVLFFSLGDYEKAISYFKTVVSSGIDDDEHNPFVASSTLYLKFCYLSLKEIENADKHVFNHPLFEFINELGSHQEENKTKIIIKGLVTMYESNKEEIEKNAPSSVNANMNFALALFKFYQGKYEEAKGFCEKSLILYKECKSDRHPHYGRNLVLIGDIYLKQDRVELAIENYEKALEIVSYSLGTECTIYIDILTKLTYEYFNKKDYKKSHENYLFLKHIYEQKELCDSLRYGMVLFYLGCFFKSKEETCSYFEKCLSIFEQKIEDCEVHHYAFLWNILIFLGQFYCLEDPDKSLIYLKKSLTIYRNNLSDECQKIAIVFYILSLDQLSKKREFRREVFQEINQFATEKISADNPLRRLLIREKERKEKVLESISLAANSRKKKDYKKAIEYYLLAKRMLEQGGNLDGNIGYGRLLYELGTTHIILLNSGVEEDQNKQKACIYFERCLSIFEQKLQDYKVLGEILIFLGQFYCCEDPDKSLIYSKKALTIYRNNFPDEPGYILILLDTLCKASVAKARFYRERQDENSRREFERFNNMAMDYGRKAYKLSREKLPVGDPLKDMIRYYIVTSTHFTRPSRLQIVETNIITLTVILVHILKGFFGGG